MQIRIFKEKLQKCFDKSVQVIRNCGKSEAVLECPLLCLQAVLFLGSWYIITLHTLSHEMQDGAWLASLFHAGQWVKLCGHQVCLWCQLTKLTDGGGQQSILGHHRIVRLAGCVGRTILMHSRYTAWDCGQVVKMVIFSKRQQFIWKFGRCIFFIRLFSLMPFIILGWAIYNNKEGLPWCILVMNLQIKHKSHQICLNKYL